ncbi:hypothetical protein Tco_1418799 [Tanacetum coccineum]
MYHECSIWITSPSSILVIPVGDAEVYYCTCYFVSFTGGGSISFILHYGHQTAYLGFLILFLCSDDSKVDDEFSPERHESLAPSSEFPLAPVVAPPKILGPFPAHILAWRRVSYRSSDRHSSPDFTSDSLSSSSYSDSSSVHSSGCDASGQSHSGTSTRVASPRLVDPRLGLHDVVPLYSFVSRLITPALADLLPRKRFRDSYSSKVSGEEHMEIGTANAKTVADLGVSDGVRASGERVGLADRVRSLG